MGHRRTASHGIWLAISLRLSPRESEKERGRGIFLFFHKKSIKERKGTAGHQRCPGALSRHKSISRPNKATTHRDAPHGRRGISHGSPEVHLSLLCDRRKSPGFPDFVPERSGAEEDGAAGGDTPRGDPSYLGSGKLDPVSFDFSSMENGVLFNEHVVRALRHLFSRRETCFPRLYARRAPL